MSAEKGGEKEKRKKRGGGQNRYGDLSVNRHLCSVDVAATKAKAATQGTELRKHSESSALLKNSKLLRRNEPSSVLLNVVTPTTLPAHS